MIDAGTWLRYQQLRELGASRRKAAAVVGVSYDSATKFDQGLTSTRGATVARSVRAEKEKVDNQPVAYEDLSMPAQLALEDFGFFRKRYFGRDNKPWQNEAAEQVVRMLEEPGRSWLVVNVPPGSGKSTTFTHDIPAWLICRDRTVRMMIGSRTQRQARNYVMRLKRSLERVRPIEGAEATLVADFGSFKPSMKDLWRNEEFVVWQDASDASPDEKEPTCTGYGMDSGFLGGRFEFVIWDDLVDNRTISTEEARDKQRNWYENEAETRLEPDGLMVLQGQRLANNDLYRYALDMPGAEPETSKYEHVIYKAHYEDRCQDPNGPHEKVSPYPSGCLLDPTRLPWSYLQQVHNKNPRRFQVLMQQQDVDPEGVLVPYEFIEGGTYEGQVLPGCKDLDRGLRDLPVEAWHDRSLSVITVDPSPTKNWAVQWWVYDPDTEKRYLMDSLRGPLDVPQFLDRTSAGQYVGMLDEWVVASAELGWPVDTVIMETNVAQRFMLQYSLVQDWATMRGVTFISHDTHVSKKADPEFGVQQLQPHYRWGRVRLPFADTFAASVSHQLIDEVTTWPDGDTDDQVMAHWFLEWSLPNLHSARMHLPKRTKLPSWLGAR